MKQATFSTLKELTSCVAAIHQLVNSFKLLCSLWNVNPRYFINGNFAYHKKEGALLKFVFIRDNQRSLILHFTILPTRNEKEPQFILIFWVAARHIFP